MKVFNRAILPLVVLLLGLAVAPQAGAWGSLPCYDPNELINMNRGGGYPFPTGPNPISPNFNPVWGGNPYATGQMYYPQNYNPFYQPSVFQNPWQNPWQQQPQWNSFPNSNSTIDYWSNPSHWAGCQPPIYC
jgi:hypothetical protein